jgi:hypothetical protein
MNERAGGWPNGGKGGSSYNEGNVRYTTSAGSGGGATEVYLDEGESRNRILVAGGGGGAAAAPRPNNGSGPSMGIPGGDAGSEPVPAVKFGETAEAPGNVTTKSYSYPSGLSAPYSYMSEKSGQYSPIVVVNNWSLGQYANNSEVNYGKTVDGQAGYGADGPNGSKTNGYKWEGGGGGGGGYIGGDAVINSKISGSGGGGDNHVGEGFIEEVNGTSTMYGNGSFKIEYVGN